MRASCWNGSPRRPRRPASTSSSTSSPCGRRRRARSRPCWSGSRSRPSRRRCGCAIASSRRPSRPRCRDSPRADWRRWKRTGKMHDFAYRHGELYCEDVALSRVAKEVGTPCYLYSHATLVRHFRVFDGAFQGVPHIVAFAMKANSNLAILRLMAREGSGADIVSGGELYRALKAGIPPSKIVFAGVGKSREELRAALAADVLMFNVESSAELRAIDEVAAELGRRARVALRINPDIDPKTHPYISTGLKKSKFGISADRAVEEYKLAAS